VNLLAHVRVALDVAGDEPGVVLGSILPDLESLVRQRLAGREDHPEIAAGLAVHHATDAVFHDHPTFRTGSVRLSRTLQAAGVARGPSRAVGHAGWELLLDGLLVEDTEVTRAFGAAAELLGELAADGPGPADRLAAVAERQRALPIWASYGDPALIADRLHRQLAHRPRLALPAEHLDVVAGVLAEVRDEVAVDGPPVLAEVTEATRLACRP
jgi:hypothetical protein